MQRKKWQQQIGSKRDWRIEFFLFGMIIFAAVIIVKLFVIQIMDHETYAALASGQHELFKKLYPERGHVFAHDGKDLSLIPVITNHQLAFLYADPRLVKDASSTIAAIAAHIPLTEDQTISLKERLSQEKDPYEPIKRGVSKDVMDQINTAKLPGIFSVLEPSRLYPEAMMSGHVLGFLGSNKEGKSTGKYGIEGFFDKELSGTEGFLKTDRDIAGRMVAVGTHTLQPAKNGSDIILTLDRTIQFKACSVLQATVLKHGADGGSIIIVEPSTGRILAMCGNPDYDPNHFNQVKNINDFNNPSIFGSYEPGSVFKPITMAAAVDVGAVSPSTTFEDTGMTMVDGWPKPIRNAQDKKYGVVDMTTVLEESINTGMIFTVRKMGSEIFSNYVKKFGFGKITGIELETESPGNISSLEKKSEIFRATASFGQGISVTPLQIVMAYAAIANGGILKKPYIVDEIRHPDGTVDKRSPQDVTQVISQKTSRTLGAMLVAVVEYGHGKRAGVSGYYIGGKTGTAQVASENGGYSEDNTIGSFAGFGPVEDPKFAMIVRIDHPRDVQWAESTAAPFFGEMAKFLLQYFEVPPIRSLEKSGKAR